MSLLYLASQLGKKISKFSLVEFENFRATTVIGQIFLKIININPSAKIHPKPIHIHLSILSAITA